MRYDPVSILKSFECIGSDGRDGVQSSSVIALPIAANVSVFTTRFLLDRMSFLLR